MGETSIEWTDWSVNPIRARLGNGDGHYCEKISPGCKHCYSSRLQPRFRMPQFGEQRGKAEPYFDASKLQQVLSRRKPTKIFWCDMTDLFGYWVPDEWIAACFGVMAATPQHTHQVLTKRIERAVRWFEWVSSQQLAEGTAHPRIACYLAARRPWALPDERRLSQPAWPTPGPWPLPNVVLGVSTENQKYADERIPLLLQCPAAVRFVSAEPLLGPIDFGSEYFTAKFGRYPFPSLPPEHRTRFIHLLDWVIVGGESGPGARPCDVEWIRSIVRQCRDAGVACFCKQMGARPHDGMCERCDGTGELAAAIQAPGLPRIACPRCDGIGKEPIGLVDRKGGAMEEWPADLRVRQFPGVRS